MFSNKLIHKITVKADPKYKDLSLHEKVALMDQFMNPEGNKALIVNFDFSHTGRKINRRIYSKIGHLQTAKDLTTPYNKPITLNHDNEAEKTIGRIIGASYIDLRPQASIYFQDKQLSITLLNDLDSALTSLDFEKARDILRQKGFVHDKTWAGIGKVAAKARITDKDAIERFLDQRFQTFSAETESDMMVCSDCLDNLIQLGSACEHFYGEKDAFFMTGNMTGGGSSVVVHPGDDLSFVTSLYFSDSADTGEIPQDLIIVDSTQDLIIVDEEKVLMNELIKKFVLDEEMTEEEKDALYEQVSTSYMKEGDKDLKLSKEERNSLPKSIFASSKKNFPIVDELHAGAALWMLQAFINEPINGRLEEIPQEVSDAVGRRAIAFSPGVDIDEKLKFTLEVNKSHNNEYTNQYTYDSLKALETDKLQLLLDTVKTVAIEANLFEDQQVKIDELTTILSDKNTALTKALEDANIFKHRQEAIKIEYKELLKDHKELFLSVDKSSTDLDSLIVKLIPVINILDTKNPISDNSDNSLEIVLSKLDSLDLEYLSSKLNDGLASSKVSKIDSPVFVADNSTNTHTPTEYEKGLIDKYKKIFTDQGEVKANAWFTHQKRYCTKEFHPSNFMEK